MISTATSRRSRLLELPAEIRENIFEFALTSDKPVVAFSLDQYQRDSYQEATQPDLTRVNRQIRNESLPLFYQANGIVLHTDSSKADDTRRWLQCIEPHLSKLNRLLLWIRYVTLTNDRNSASGAICVSLQRSRSESSWRVNDEWRWITVTRQPSSARGDAKFLIAKLRSVLLQDPGLLNSAEGCADMMIDLKKTYIKEKMS